MKNPCLQKKKKEFRTIKVILKELKTIVPSKKWKMFELQNYSILSSLLLLVFY